MKSKLVIIILATLLFACAGPSTLADLREKYGPPAKIERIDSTTRYFYYYKVRFRTTWVTYEYTGDETGKIVKFQKYWRQPEVPTK